MLRDLVRAVSQLGDPRSRRVVILSVLGAVTLFVGLVAGMGWLAAETALFQTLWLDWLVDALSVVGLTLLSWLLFPAVVVAISSLMLEDVARAVEDRHYPGRGPARPQPVLEGIWNAVKFLGLVLLLNLLALPLYFVPGVGFLVFPAINGYLLGREYYELVAYRRMDPSEAKEIRRENGVRLFAAGAIIAFLSVVPFVNLLVPVVATAFMVHLFEGMRRPLPRGFGA